ncbi:FKBP-type peptidyl-prolyl cis-trans isomerase [Fulvimonas sp. R45]|uniref:FKBP-type peptidyl-prolyl cis-trans isomerase n=1 Tax=Fulvimonas sp. R45 TaxID=3045937 RepID=UPI00265FFB46|nr:FKBP-type peptidyl-prolyl cis-trans isomerase [Fulvimonas sp. R45]MDO1527813.1 FKBP-type peptidyl-prolyl cis-trans isomerase [Fulvimonas sp. R45]
MRRLLFTATFALAASAFALQAPAGTDGLASLQKIDRTVGTGTVARDGDVVRVDYTGWLYDAGAKDHHGKQFDSSYDNGQPISFTLGAGQVIEGWDQGIRGMHVGGRRTLVIPARLAYGDRGAGEDIPPGATLVFDVVLLGVN